MKKILFSIFLLFILIMKIGAVNTFYLGEKVPNMYIEEYDDYNLHNGAPYVLKRSDGAIVYCLNPFLYLNTTNEYKAYNFNYSVFNLTEKQIDRMNAISHFGYGYNGHEDLKWYGITQFLIWKEMNFNDIYFTDTHYGQKIVAYESEIKEIENLVEEFYRLPSFSSEKLILGVNSKNTIIDLNNVLSKYSILRSNIDAHIEDNSLIIDTKEEGNYTIKFIRSSNVYKDYLLYHLDGAQDVLYPGMINDVMFIVNIEVKNGSITINKVDSEKINRIEATLEGAVYGVYNEDELITTVTTNENGVGFIDNLPFGDYYIKEIEASKGYELDNNVYKVSIDYGNENLSINSKEEVIKGSITLKKVDSENKTRLEATLNGAVYGLYKDNNLIEELITNEEGIAYIDNIEYGKYYIKEISPSIGYNLDENIYEINILNDDNNILTLKENIISSKVTLIVKDSEDKNRLEATLEGSVYGLYKNNNLIEELITNEEGIAYIDNVEYGKYYIKEISPSIGYNLDENIYEISILNNDEIILNIMKDVIYGNLIIKKYYGDSNFYKTEDDAVFEIYDINNNLVSTCTTIEGIINIKLEYGNYVVKQKKGKNNYSLVEDFEIYIFKDEKYVFNLYDEKEETLVVEVPDTFRKDSKYLFSTILIIFGILIILINKIKSYSV